MRLSHCCPQDPTGYVYFMKAELDELVWHARREGKAKIPPIARIQRMEPDKDRIQWIIEKKKNKQPIDSTNFKIVIWHLQTLFQDFF